MSQGSVSFWSDLRASDFERSRLGEAVAVLPLGAIEQHGPHLPVGTDAQISQGMIAALRGAPLQSADVLVLPAMQIANSVEHVDAPGTVSLGRELTIEMVFAVAASVHRAGVRKLVLINAHGGNVGVMVDASHAIRQEFGMLCVATNWMRLGLPGGIIAETARAVDVHGGHLETALMLALRPDYVAMGEARSFPSLQGDLAERYHLLRAYGPIGFGWMGRDLNAAGVVGSAAAATAEQGQRIIAHQVEQFALLLDEVADFTPGWFAQ
ncbi:MAG: creatininase family protein [Pseudomonadota bacterium]